MYCENCGKQIEDGAKFCRYCGAKTDVTEILADTVGRVGDAGTAGETAAAVVTGIPEAGVKDKKRKLKTGFIVAIAVVFMTALAVLIGLGIYNKPENRLARALDLGQKYLLEENYEQAIVEFGRAIEIDPKNEEAYIGLAEAYAETDDLEKAVRALEKGTDRTNSDELREMLERYAEELAKEEAAEAVAKAEALKDTGARESAVSAEVEPEKTTAPAEEKQVMEPQEPEAPAEEQTMETESAGQDPAGMRTKRYDHEDGSYSIDTYDDNGNLVKWESYNTDGSLGNYVLYIYDGNGNHIKSEDYNADGNLDGYSLYIHDGTGKCKKGEYYNADGTLDFYYLYIYDGNGICVRGECYNADGSLSYYELYTYDGNGNRIKYEWYNADGSLQDVLEY